MPERILWRGEQGIRRKLQLAVDQALKPDSDIHGTIRTALVDMVCCLKEALDQSEGHDAKPRDIYFWPGYDSILSGGEQAKRVTLAEDDRPLGMGFDDQGLKYGECFSSIAFDALLTPHREDILPSGQAFIPGGTHSFFASSDLMLPGEYPLTALSVLIGRRKRMNLDGVMEIVCRRSGFASWGKSIAEALNDISKLPDRSSKPRTVIWPHTRGAVDSLLSPAELSEVNDIRRALYSLWLLCNSGVVPTDPADPAISRWTSKLVTDLRDRGLADLAERIEDLAKKAPLSQRHLHPCWYTLNLEPTVRSTPATSKDARSVSSDELGSLMILSSGPLDGRYLVLIKPWVERIYGWMRAVESTVLTLRVGADAQTHEFVHQIAGLIGLIRQDRGLRNLSPVAQNAAWHLGSVVRVWAASPFPSSASVFEIDDRFWDGYIGKTDEEFMDTLVDLSLRHALMRASQLAESELDRVAGTVRRFAVANMDKPHLVLEHLGFERRGKPPRWITSLGFVTMFHHCFWQAAYHAIRASFDETLTSPYLWIECAESELVIVDRSHATSEKIAASKDRSFYKRLFDRTRGQFKCDPSYDERGRESAVRTSIQYAGDANVL